VHFGLSEDHELLQETLQGFLGGECPLSRMREIFDEGSGFDADIWNGLAEMGLTALLIPEAHGGAELGILELALVAELAGGAALPGPLVEHSLACLAITRGGSPEQQQRWLPRLASGELIGTVALSEEDGRWEPSAWTATVSEQKLCGVKAYVPHAQHAGLAVVGVAGGELVLVETDNVEKTPQEGIDRGRTIGRLHFENAACEPLAGAGIARLVRDAGLAALAADSFGAATRLVALSAAYAMDRKQFGFPIAQFQAVKHQIARIGTDIEPTRALFWYAAHALDAGLPDAERSAAMANAHITDRAALTARAAVELHGGLGFTWECDVQIFFKRALFNRAFLGTPEVQRERCAELAGW
jgi:alkylation response protein AidB-like acyl-CoA dehydrogenase